MASRKFVVPEFPKEEVVPGTFTTEVTLEECWDSNDDSRLENEEQGHKPPVGAAFASLRCFLALHIAGLKTKVQIVMMPTFRRNSLARPRGPVPLFVDSSSSTRSSSDCEFLRMLYAHKFEIGDRQVVVLITLIRTGSGKTTLGTFCHSICDDNLSTVANSVAAVVIGSSASIGGVVVETSTFSGSDALVEDRRIVTATRAKIREKAQFFQNLNALVFGVPGRGQTVMSFRTLLFNYTPSGIQTTDHFISHRRLGSAASGLTRFVSERRLYDNGRGTISAFGNLWILAHQETNGNWWWPQGGEEVRIKNGEFSFEVVHGDDGDIEKNFEVAALAHVKLWIMAWVLDSAYEDLVRSVGQESTRTTNTIRPAIACRSSLSDRRVETIDRPRREKCARFTFMTNKATWQKAAA